MLGERTGFVAPLAFLVVASAANACSSSDAPKEQPLAPPDCRAPSPAPAFLLTDIFPGITFDRPVAVARAGDVYFVAEQAGRVRRIVREGDPWTENTFLDVSSKLATDQGESGLIGFVPSPFFDATGEVFIAYLDELLWVPFRTVIARLTSNDRVTADPASEEKILVLERDQQGHNGGRLVFGPDQMLYVAIGDGSWGDPSLRVRAQNPNELFGKVLRIDPLSEHPYRSPPDNPYAAGGGRPEVFASGFRNPWSFSFDTKGRLWLGDVGESRWEEINVVERGGNYGWPIREGRHCFEATSCASDSREPVHEYAHIDGLAVTGGYVYRGSRLALRGQYVFGDFMTGRLWSLDPAAPKESRLLVDTGLNISGFGEDAEGELLVLDYSGHVLRLDPAPPAVDPALTSLRALGCLDAAGEVTTSLVPYEVTTPLWSDNLEKRRWVGVPKDTSIHVTDDDALDFPVGSLLLKEFSSKGKRIETRMFVRDADVGWVGYTFEWNAEQSDAVLVDESKTVDVDGAPWSIPSRAQCMACHTSVAGRVLGFRPPQLSNALAGEQEPQLERFWRMGLIDRHIDASKIDALSDLSDESASIERRARSYLDANCSFCHRPFGPGQGVIDFRVGTQLADMRVVCRRPDTTDTDTDEMLVAPRDPSRSAVLRRMSTRGEGQMPPLGSGRVDTKAVDLLSSWVASLEACP